MEEQVSEFISKPPEDQEWAERMGREEAFKAGYAITEIYRSLPNPEAIRDVTRELMCHHEDISLTLENLSTRYDLTPILAPIRNRRLALSYTNERLRELGIVVKREDGTFEAKAAGFALRVDTKEKEKKITKKIETQQVDEKGDRLTDKEGNLLPPRIEIRTETIKTTEEEPDFGTNEQRKEMADALREAEAEIVVRQLVYEHFKYYRGNTENLEGIAQFYLMPQPTAEALKLFFNLKDVQGAKTETAGGGEVKTFGDKVDMAMRLYYIVALSEKTEKLWELRETPGWQIVFPDSQGGKDGISEQERHWIGNVYEWASGTRRIEGITEKEDDLQNEIIDGKKRRELTLKGNIFAHGRYKFKDSVEAGPEQIAYVRGKIKEFLGDDSSAEAAEETAFRLFRLWALAAEMGFEIYQKDGELKLEYEMGPASTDDFAKITRPWMYQWKQIAKPKGRRRDAGPLGTWGKYDRFFISFLRRTSCPTKVPGYPPLLGGEVQTRSLLEQWWGYKKKEKVEIEDENKKIVEVNLPFEEAKRLGEMEWDKFDASMLNGFYLGAFMAGRKEIGVYQLTRKTDWNPTSLLELTNPDWWGNFHKYIQVAITDALAADGIWRGKKESGIEKKKEEIWDKIVSGLWDGIRSLPQYEIWKSQGVPVAVVGTPWKVPIHVIPIIVEVVEEVTNGRIKLPIKPLEINRKEAEQNLLKKAKLGISL